MDRDQLRQVLSDRQSGKCIVPNCLEEPRPNRRLSSWLDMHRLATGSGYVDGNVVLVCRSHHKLVDGLSLEEILAKDGATFRAERHITATTQLLEAAALALFFLEATGYGNGHTADVLRAAISRSTRE